MVAVHAQQPTDFGRFVIVVYVQFGFTFADLTATTSGLFERIVLFECQPVEVFHATLLCDLVVSRQVVLSPFLHSCQVLPRILSVVLPGLGFSTYPAMLAAVVLQAALVGAAFSELADRAICVAVSTSFGLHVFSDRQLFSWRLLNSGKKSGISL